MRSSHGGDIYRNRVAFDFSVNVNPYGMPDSLSGAIVDSLRNAACYPDPEMTELRTALAEKELGSWAGDGNVICGNGACELIYALCSALKPKAALMPAPTFKEYEAGVEISGGKMVFDRLSENNAFQLTDSILEKITPEVSLLFLCNPNNPTGQAIEKELLMRIAARCEECGTFFCLDECFLPFLREEDSFSLRGQMHSFPHLMILRAFTKIFGMAGIRFGYLLSENAALLERVRSVIQPWNVSIPAQAAAEAALKEDAFVRQTQELIAEERGFLLCRMRALGVEVIGEPAANFIFFKGSKDLQERFLEKGVLIRSCSNFTGLSDGYFRIGIRKPEENRTFVSFLNEILNQR